jgi:hypothetical protein
MSETLKNESEVKLSPAFPAAAKLRKEKGGDYGGIKEYFPFGDYSYVQMLHIKTKRLVSLQQSGNVPKHEDVRQNLLDLINYASYYWEWLEGVLDE